LPLVFGLTALEDQIDAGTADDEIVVYHRFLVNATKYALSVDATVAVRSAIEVLGGNGTIEDFSVLPRLYRDSIVYESWEGTHNVLVAQVLADLHRLPILDVVAERIRTLCNTSVSPAADRTLAELDDALGDMHRSMTDAAFGARYFRGVLDRVVAIARVASLLEGGEPVAAEHLLNARVIGVRPQDDPGYAARVDELASAE
jgi:hypothetical protein